ncbi:MAG TPA: oligosaccharide flippase family protein [Vicinamibacterales bacterium]
MSPSRTRRFVGGLSLGYLHTAIVTIVGLWLTPYLLRNLDQHDYGLWLLTAQILFYLALTDVGIVALLPREVAFTTGRAGDTLTADLQRLVGETTRLVLWQLPMTATVGFAMWWLAAAESPGLGGLFAIVVSVFVATFPLRILHALLQGLQDLAFVGGARLIAWIVGTMLTVALVEAGVGINALAAGWACTQLVGAGLAWWRLCRRFPGILPRRLPSLSIGWARLQLGRGAWVSIGQMAQVLINGTDLLVIGALLGPAAVVPYACTGKLMTLLANQPQLFMQTAAPALSELRTSVPRAHTFEVVTALSQLLLIGSGLIACVVLTVNAPFVSWWVGPDQFAGSALTGLLVFGMLLRHWNVAAVYTLICFGNERRLAITCAVDGLVGVLAMLALVPWLGLYGAALGSLIGTAAISLPFNLTALAREEGVSLVAAIRPLRPWFLRFLPAAATTLLAIAWWPEEGILKAALGGGLVAIVYTALMLPVVLTPPLGSILGPRLQPWLTFFPGLSRRLASQSMP